MSSFIVNSDDAIVGCGSIARSLSCATKYEPPYPALFTLTTAAYHHASISSKFDWFHFRESALRIAGYELCDLGHG